MRMVATLALALLLAACGPKMDGLEKGEAGTGAEVRDGDTFTLADGLTVHLAGLEAPRFEAPRSAESRAALEKLVAHRPVQLAYGGQKRARDAAVAHVFARTEGGRWVWVQEAMLLNGEARVRTRRDQVSRLAEMLAAESAARAGKRGLWADPAYAVRDAGAMARDDVETALDPLCVAEAAQLAAARAARDAAPPAAAQTIAAETESEERPRRPRRQRDFHIVEGVVTGVAERERAVFLNFGDDIARDFGVLLPTDAAAAWPGGVDAVKEYEGKRIRVRGEVPRCGKPLMRVDHFQQIEALD